MNRWYQPMTNTNCIALASICYRHRAGHLQAAKAGVSLHQPAALLLLRHYVLDVQIPQGSDPPKAGQGAVSPPCSCGQLIWRRKLPEAHGKAAQIRQLADESCRRVPRQLHVQARQAT